MIKKSPIKKPFFFDTPQGVDDVTKTVAEDSIEKMTPLKKDQLDKLNRDMKLSLLKFLQHKRINLYTDSRK